MAKTKTKIPDPRMRDSTYYCPEDGCSYKNDKAGGYRMHWLQKHSDTFHTQSRAALASRKASVTTATVGTTRPARRGWRTAGDVDSDLPAPIASSATGAPARAGSLREVMFDILQANDRPMSKLELLTAVRSSDFETAMDDTQLSSYLGSRVRCHPEGGIVQPSPGTFALGTADQDYRAKRAGARSPVREPEPEVVDSAVSINVDLAVELRVLRRRMLKAQEIIMKLSQHNQELVMIAAD